MGQQAFKNHKSLAAGAADKAPHSNPGSRGAPQQDSPGPACPNHLLRRAIGARSPVRWARLSLK